MSDLDEDLLALAGADESEEEDQVLTTTSAKRAKKQRPISFQEKEN